MDEIMGLLTQELALCNELDTAVEKQRRALKGRLNGEALRGATREVEMLFARLGEALRQREVLLAHWQAETLAQAIRQQPYSARKIEAWRCLEQIQTRLDGLRQTSRTNQALLDKEMEYLSFSLNVMTQAQAGPGYDAPKESEKAIQRRKLFDQSI